MTLDQHIEELRAELRGVNDPRELRQIEAELEAAEAERRATYEAWLARPD